MSVDIKQKDVIRLMLQYMKENGLHNSFHALQKESQIGLNIVESKEGLHHDIKQGKWDVVLRQIQRVSLPSHILMELYEQIIFELLEIGEKDTCSHLLKKAISDLREEFPDRLANLDYLIKQNKTLKNQDLYGFQDPTMTKEKRRKQLSDNILENIDTVRESRLLELLGQSLKYQEIKGLIPSSIKMDIFLDKIVQQNYKIVDEFPNTISKSIKYPIESKVNAVVFSSNGGFLVTGSNDGIIEVLDSLSGKIRTDLAYQAEQSFMLHSKPLTSLALSRDNEILASGDLSGNLKIWRIQNGKCLKKCSPFQGYISKIIFGKDVSHLIVASDFIQVIGLKSGNTLKIFKGHKGTITDLVQFEVNQKQMVLMSASNEGKIMVWDFGSTECIQTITPPSETPGKMLSISNIIPLNQEFSQFLICNTDQKLTIINQNGELIKQFGIDKTELQTQFMFACISPKKQWVYAIGSNNLIYCFNMNSGKLEQSLKIAEKDQESSGIYHNPTQNQIVTYLTNGTMLFLTP